MFSFKKKTDFICEVRIAVCPSEIVPQGVVFLTHVMYLINVGGKNY